MSFDKFNELEAKAAALRQKLKAAYAALKDDDYTLIDKLDAEAFEAEEAARNFALTSLVKIK